MDVKVLSLDNLSYFKTKQDLYNDSKFATKNSIPTDVSQLVNDAEYQTKTQLDAAIEEAINNAVSSVMTYKGTKNSPSELPQEGNKLGDVWHVTSDTAEYAWDGTKWEVLGSTMNVSVAWDDITGKPSEFTPTEHTHDDATTDVSGFMSAADKTKLNGIQEGATKYTHPTAKRLVSGMYKITTNAEGHITEGVAVVKGDITALGIPEQDTTYSLVTQSENGLMASTDKVKLDGLNPVSAIENSEIDSMF